MANSGQIIIPYGDAPATPASGKTTFYSKSNKNLYYKTDDGVEHIISTVSGTDHADLKNLDQDDHAQYLLATGARNITGVISYNATKSITAAAQIPDKNYVDTAITNALPAFGKNFQQTSSESLSSHTGSSTWQTKVTLNTTGLTIDHIYRVGWSAGLASSKENAVGPYGRMLMDGTTELSIIAATGLRDYLDSTDMWYSLSGFYIFTATTTNHSFSLQYALDSSRTGDTVYMRRARIEFWRVA